MKVARPYHSVLSHQLSEEMDVDASVVLSVALISYAAVMLTRHVLNSQERLPRRKGKRKWVKEILLERQREGTAKILIPKLLSDTILHINYLRMDSQSFEILVQLIAHRITGKDTKMRRCISPSEKLAVTLRYLATGKLIHSSFVILTFI